MKTTDVKQDVKLRTQEDLTDAETKNLIAYIKEGLINHTFDESRMSKKFNVVPNIHYYYAFTFGNELRFLLQTHERYKKTGMTNEDLIAYINSIQDEDVANMDIEGMYLLIGQGQLRKEILDVVINMPGLERNTIQGVKDALGLNEPLSEEQLREKGNLINVVRFEDPIDDISIFNEEAELALKEDTDILQHLPKINGTRDFDLLDGSAVCGCDNATVQFFINKTVHKAWSQVISGQRDPQDIINIQGGVNTNAARNIFVRQWNMLQSYNPSKDFAYRLDGHTEVITPNIMQKLACVYQKELRRCGNFSDTGTGKTLAMLLSSDYVGARLSVIIGVNSTVLQLEKEVLNAFPSANVHIGFTPGKVYDKSERNFVLLNYEKFQQIAIKGKEGTGSAATLRDLNNNNVIDYIALDEIHNAKYSGKDDAIRRQNVLKFVEDAQKKNPKVNVCGASATPVINNLKEAVSLLEMITGKEYKHVATKASHQNALSVRVELMLCGFRYRKESGVQLEELNATNTPSLRIDGVHLVKNIAALNGAEFARLERILIKDKLQCVYDLGHLTTGTLLYSYFTDTDGIFKEVSEFLKSKGISYAYYSSMQSNEDRTRSLNRFIGGEVQVLIAGRMIGTGVDGLQRVCNRTVCLNLPWTAAEYHQLIGRTARQGSNFDTATVILPQVVIDVSETDTWSWDIQRRKIIKRKGYLADAAVDGIIRLGNDISRDKLLNNALEAMRDWKERVNNGELYLIERDDLKLPFSEKVREQSIMRWGDFSQLNQKWSVSKSSTTFERLKGQPQEWYLYHDLYRKTRETWTEMPIEEIAKDIRKRPSWVVADMGCGENLLAPLVKDNQVHAFDFVAYDDSVTACDMSNIPMEAESVDAVVFSLSLMGVNYVDSLKESHRILKPFGHIFIAEPQKKFETNEGRLLDELKSLGYRGISIRRSSNFVYLTGTK